MEGAIPETATLLRSAEAATQPEGATRGVGGVRAKVAADAVGERAEVPRRVPTSVPSPGAVPRLRQVGEATGALAGQRAPTAVGATFPTEPTPGVQALPSDCYRLKF